MKALDGQSNHLLVGESQLTELQMERFFNVLKATVVSSRVTMTATFLSVQNVADFSEEEIQELEEAITLYLDNQIRQTDLLFKLSNPLEWCILLSQSREEETTAFLNRLFTNKKDVKPFSTDLPMVATVAEIGNRKVVYQVFIEKGKASLSFARQRDAWHIDYMNDFKEKEVEMVKVSILEENEIFSNALSASIKDLAISHFQLDIQVFKDGYEFLESNFYHSSHTHLIIMNDILPRKNGLEVLQTLRKLPNQRKFTIFMMDKRKSEADMLYAYEKGVDEYLIKPFNLRLFEAQIKRIFERLWS